MLKLNNSYILLLFIAQFTYSQVDVVLRGVIHVDDGFVNVVNVTNENSNQQTISDNNGQFSINVKPGDLIFFSATGLNDFKFKVSEQNVLDAFVTIRMVPETILLNEVIVAKRSDINEVSLGIVPKNQKKYTQAERRLVTTGDFKPIMLLGLLAGSMPLDPLINKINGRTKRVKKQISIERRQINLAKLTAYFDDEFYSNQLKICNQYIEGFKVYVIENDTFVNELNKNKTAMLQFMLIDLAVKYKEIISCEKK